MSAAELGQSAGELASTPAARGLQQADLALGNHELGVAMLALARTRLPLARRGATDELERRAHALEKPASIQLGTTLAGTAPPDAELSQR